MLRGLRKASANWLGRIIMAAVVLFLVISFGIWGIGDIFRGFGISTVAKIGRTEISIDQFRQQYNERLQQLGQQLRRPITPDQARALGLEQQILSQMIGGAALDERVRQLGLNMSDTDVVKHIKEDPAFRGLNGEFDENRFQQLIRQAGYSEPRFVSEQRRYALRRQITSAITGEVAPPKTAAQLLDRYQNEERSIEFVTLDGNKLGDIPMPTPEELAAYYDAHKATFRAPEYRKLVVVTVSPEELAKTVEVSDEDAKRAYDIRLNRYTVPERRQIQQIAFPTAEEAEAAAKQIADGTSFDMIVMERKLTDKDIDLGTVTRGEMIDPAIADAAFSLPADGVSGAIKGRFANAIVRVVKIEPGSTRPFEAVAQEIKHEIAVDRAKGEVNKIRDKIEDEYANGTKLADIAKKLNLPVVTIDAVDRAGRSPADQPVEGLPKGVDILNDAFLADQGAENDPLTIPGGGFIWFEVDGITPSRERSLDEVKAKVEARWRDDEIAKRLDAKTAEIVDKLKAGTPFAEVAMGNGLIVEMAAGIKRQGSASVPQAVAAQVFKTAKDGIGSAEGRTPEQRIVFKLTDIKEPTFEADGAAAKPLQDQLKSSYGEELLTQYVNQLESDLNTNVNPQALNQAVGRGAGN
ncbi:MAG: SurA N-terminal domain-containing protein [Xanthobacteraceae bacterium]|nr:SurA N-terminal domain-containing protein [Xanthobacteraceae bacterium]